MKYLPFERLTYRTDLSLEEVIQHLQENVEPKKNFRMNGLWKKGPHKPYEGRISGKFFDLMRIINYRNSFLPKIKGQVEEHPDGTRIHVKMKPSEFVFVFLGIWCTGVGVGLIAILSSSLSAGTFEPLIFAPIGMLLFAYLLVTLSFKYESSRSKKDLGEIFEAEIESQ